MKINLDFSVLKNLIRKNFASYQKTIISNSKKLPREHYLIFFFAFVLLTLFFRLFYLQVVQADFYKKLLIWQHFTQSLLKANRWNIFLLDKSWKEIKLTESIDLYTLYVDPKFVINKPKVKDILAPIIYKHFCELYWLEKPTKIECINNIQKFTWKTILNDKEEYDAITWNKQSDTIIMTWENQSDSIALNSEISTNNKLLIDPQNIEKMNQEIIDKFSSWDAIALIWEKLATLLTWWIREMNYFGFFDNDKVLEDLKNLNLNFVLIDKHYVYFVPHKVTSIDDSTRAILDVFSKYWYAYTFNDIKTNLLAKEIRYTKIISEMNSQLAKEIKDLKKDYYTEKYDSVPLLHWIWLEKNEKRYYPYGEFLSHVIWYLDDTSTPYYGIEKFFDYHLKWIDGKMVWLSVPWIWAIWSNNLDMQQPIDWSDVYLTIDMSIQKEAEKLLKFYYNDLKPDSISLLLMEPDTGKIRAMANYPTFDPNFYKDIYKITPVDWSNRLIIDDNSYVDMPVLILSWDKLKTATIDERKNPDLKKFIFKNIIWPNVFVDKNIWFPYEPWSIFKLLTLAIWMDTDEISMYDLYQDDMHIEVGPYTISNVHQQCKWYNTFVHAIERSCNVWMVKIAQKIKKRAFYNYLNRLWLGKKTWIQLDWEEDGRISANDDFSLARFFNNSFWQWILVTPVQMAVSYAAMVNGWYLVEPTIVEKLFDKKNNQFINIDKQIKNRVFKPSTSEKIKEALFKVVSEWDLVWINITWYTLGWKTWTSQIAYKWNYLWWNWWTNSSFVWIITKNDLRYVIVVQVRRPRSCQWWLCTAWLIFKDLSKLLIENQGIRE